MLGLWRDRGAPPPDWDQQVDSKPKPQQPQPQQQQQQQQVEVLKPHEIDEEPDFPLVGFSVIIATTVYTARLGRRWWRGEKLFNFKLFSNERSQAPKMYYQGGFETKMTRDEAHLILNTAPGASREILMNRYRAMVKINHPDLGGSPLIATKINQAKDLLYPKLKRSGSGKSF